MPTDGKPGALRKRVRPSLVTIPAMNEQRQASPGTRGAFVVLVGPDGAGKTTVADGLLAASPGGYFHFRPPFTRARLAPRPPHQDPPATKDPGPSLAPVGWLRLARNTVSSWVGYLTSIRPALRNGELIVGDRWLYGYLVQPRPLKFAGPVWLARLAISLLPRPDLVVNLAAPAEVILGRKQELSAAEVNQEIEAWRHLGIRNLVTVNADRPPESIVAEIRRLLAASSPG